MKRRIDRAKIAAYGAVAIIAILAFLLPLLISSNYYITVLVNCLMFGSIGLAWNLISGYGGQVSWCHSVFVTIGAYTGVVLYSKFAMSPFISVLVAAGLAWILSTIIGRVSFRYRGPFFSITTIALSEIVRVLLLYFVDFTNGARGISVRYTSPNFWYLLFPNNKPFYYIGVVAVIVLIVFTKLFERSKTGYYLRAIKEDEDAAISLGIRTSKVKQTAFQISAMLTAALGVFYAFFLTFVEPNTICSVDLSIKIGSVAIVGGMGSSWGAVLGAFVIIPLTELASVLLGSSGGTQLLYGLALVIVVIFQPRGLAHLFNKNSKISTTVHKAADRWCKTGGNHEYNSGS